MMRVTSATRSVSNHARHRRASGSRWSPRTPFTDSQGSFDRASPSLIIAPGVKPFGQRNVDVVWSTIATEAS